MRLPDPKLNPWRRRLAGGMAWTLAGSVLQQASLLTASIWIARLTGKWQFGEYVLLQGTLGTFAVLASLAFSMTATRYVAAFRIQDPARTASLCRLMLVSTGIIGFVFSCALAIFAEGLAANTLREPSLAASLRWGSLYLFFQSYQGVQAGILSGIEAFHKNTEISALRAVVLLVSVFILTPRYSVTGAILALVLSALTACCHSQFLLGRELRKSGIPDSPRIVWGDLRILWQFSIPAFLSSVIVPPALWIASVMLARQAGGYLEVALFGAANQWRAVIAFLPAVLAQPLLPLLTCAWAAGDRATFQRLAFIGVLINTASTTTVALVVVLGAPVIASAYGKGFAQSEPLLIDLSIATIIGAAAGAVGYVLASTDDMWAGLVLNAIWAGAFLGMIYSHTPSLHASTVARAFLVAYLVHAVTTSVYVLYRLRRIPAVVPTSLKLSES